MEGTAATHRLPAARLIGAVVGAVARSLCAFSGGHEDIRRFEPNARRMYLQCVRCLRTTGGYCLGQSHAHAAEELDGGIPTRAFGPTPQPSMPRI